MGFYNLCCCFSSSCRLLFIPFFIHSERCISEKQQDSSLREPQVKVTEIRPIIRHQTFKYNAIQIRKHLGQHYIVYRKVLMIVLFQTGCKANVEYRRYDRNCHVMSTLNNPLIISTSIGFPPSSNKKYIYLNTTKGFSTPLAAHSILMYSHVTFAVLSLNLGVML